MITVNSKYHYNYFANNFYNYLFGNKNRSNEKRLILNDIIQGGKLEDFSFKDFYGIDILLENPHSFPNLKRFIFDLLDSFADHFCYNIERSISDGNFLIRNQNNDTILNFNFKDMMNELDKAESVKISKESIHKSNKERNIKTIQKNKSKISRKKEKNLRLENLIPSLISTH